MTVLHISERLRVDTDNIPLVRPVRELGREVLASALRAHEVSRLDFSGRHALRDDSPQGKTIHELGASTLRLPFTKKESGPRHSLDTPEPGRKSAEAITLREAPGLDPDYLYTHPHVPIPKLPIRK
jgi:hypothetical protein